MNKLVFVANNRVVTDSLTVADVFKKGHDKVLRDIRELGCSEEFRLANFGDSSYSNQQGRKMPKVIMTEQGFVLLVMGYTGQRAMEFKEQYIAAFDRMKEELDKHKQGYVLPSDFKEALLQLVEQVELNEKLQTRNLMLEQRVAEYEPKVTYVDQILQSTSTLAVTQIAQDYGLSAKQLNKILHQEKVQYKVNDQWILYAKHQNLGYTKSDTIDYFDSKGERQAKMLTKWTQKGRLFIHQILEKRGIVPFMDRKPVETKE